MATDDLLPPLHQLRDRLTRNQRERDLLRALFRLAVRAAEVDHRGAPPVCRHTGSASRPKGGAA